MSEITLPAIRYTQGSRVMYMTVSDPSSVVGLTTRPRTWDPLGPRVHGNRPIDRKHLEGIANYLEEEEEFVIGAVVLYGRPDDLEFIPTNGERNGSIAPGELRVPFRAKLEIGDGQHRIGAYSKVVEAHDQDNDVILQRLLGSGQPIIVVEDDDFERRRQDFVDLQRNAKPPTGSMGMSMDQRQAINRFTIDVTQDARIRLFAGERIEFLKDSPAKLSAKLVSFKMLRYFLGTVLTGVESRGGRQWEETASAAVTGPNAETAKNDMVGLLLGLEAVPGWADVVAGNLTPAHLRASTFLCSAGALYALALAIHMAKREGFSYAEAAEKVATLNFVRPQREPSEESPLTVDETPFAGTLVDRETGKISSGRPAWEAAADSLHSIAFKAG